ncbi:MAG: bifunctional oligoribonuclease/PAP phosphatase NrnA [Vampirovibrionales bacterium]|nr:bifunctional oligoribonuclease/PAP phosphatase NrnA [Vampirovibrionales bacterium]
MTAHVGPDGDTLGSMLALKFALEKGRGNFQRIDCVISGKMPDVYHFLPGIRDVLRFEQDQGKLLPKYDMAISVDCGSLDRLGPNGAYFDAADISVNIDHHISNDKFGKLNVVIPEAAASGEVVFDLLKEMKIALDANIATCLYTAIVTDTGGFKYGNTTAKVMETAGQLVQAGANPEYIFKQLYEEQPYEQMMMQADAFLRTEYTQDKSIGWTTVLKSDLEKFGALDEHVDGLVEVIRRVKPVLVSAVFKEMRSGHTKVSLRSDTHDIDVSKIMGIFGGGGHKMAAGCTIEETPEKARKKVLPLLEEAVQKKQLVR